MAVLPEALGWAPNQGPAWTATRRSATYTVSDRRCLLHLRHSLPIPTGALGWASAQGPPLRHPVLSCDLRAGPRLREWTILQGDGL